MQAKPGRNFLLLLAALIVGWLAAPAADAQDVANIAFRRGIGISHIMAWAPLEPAPSRSFAFPPFSYPQATFAQEDRKSTRLNSSHSSISYAVFCLKKKK